MLMTIPTAATTRSATRLFPPVHELTLDEPNGTITVYLKMGELWFRWHEHLRESVDYVRGWVMVENERTIADLNERLRSLL